MPCTYVVFIVALYILVPVDVLYIFVDVVVQFYPVLVCIVFSYSIFIFSLEFGQSADLDSGSGVLK